MVGTGKPMKNLLDRLHAFRRDEGGQSLVFGALTIFIIMFFAAMILSVGQVTARRIQMQFAADSAAYSSALVESQIANAIALLNTSMAQVRARALRYAADVNAYGVLAELRDRILNPGQGRRQALDEQIASLQRQLEAQTDPAAQAQLQARIEALRQLSESLQPGEPSGGTALPPDVVDSDRVIGIVGINRADLKYAQAYKMAERWIPAANEWLKEMSRLEYTLAILAPRLAAQAAYRAALENGAEYVSLFPASRWMPRENSYLALDVYRKGEQWWRVEGPQTTLEVKREECTGCAGCHKCGECIECWSIYWMAGLASEEMYRLCRLEDKRWFVENLMGSGRPTDEVCIQQIEDTYIVTYGPEGVLVTYHNEYQPRWLELVNLNGRWPYNTIFVRTRQGIVEYARYQWDDERDEWIMPDEGDFRPLSITAVEVDGVRVNVNLDPTIRVGSARIRLTVPAQLELGWATITLSDPVALTTTINGINVRIREESFGVGRRGYTIPMRDADGRWRTYFDAAEEYWWQHRLSLVGTDHWEYEYMEFGARMQVERNAARMLAHRDIERADVPDLEFATADCVPRWAYDSDLNPDGWLDAKTGKLVTDGEDYRYYQERTCWTCGGRGQLYFSLDTDGDGEADWTVSTPCPTCGGSGTVRVQPSDVFGRLGQAMRTSDYPHRSYQQPEDYQEANLDVKHLPLVFSEEFFKYGSTVGVWHRRESHFGSTEGAEHLERPVQYLLHDPRAGMKGLLRGGGAEAPRREILRPPWGYFTVAAARPRLNRGAFEFPFGLLQHGVYFDDPEERTFWVENDVNNLYVKSYGPERAYWDARLVPLSRQVLIEDVLLGRSFEAETGTGWLLKRIARGSPWGWTNAFDRYGVPEVAASLTGQVRPRAEYPRLGGPYVDEQGVLRDPFVEYLSARPPERMPRGGQLDYGSLDEGIVTH